MAPYGLGAVELRLIANGYDERFQVIHVIGQCYLSYSLVAHHPSLKTGKQFTAFSNLRLRLDNTFGNEIFVKDHGPAESRFLFAATVISFAQRLTLMPKGIKRMVIESDDR